MRRVDRKEKSLICPRHSLLMLPQQESLGSQLPSTGNISLSSLLYLFLLPLYLPLFPFLLYIFFTLIKGMKETLGWFLTNSAHQQSQVKRKTRCNIEQETDPGSQFIYKTIKVRFRCTHYLLSLSSTPLSLSLPLLPHLDMYVCKFFFNKKGGGGWRERQECV